VFFSAQSFVIKANRKNMSIVILTQQDGTIVHIRMHSCGASNSPAKRSYSQLLLNLVQTHLGAVLLLA
jgi:hypothetical protein